MNPPGAKGAAAARGKGAARRAPPSVKEARKAAIKTPVTEEPIVVQETSVPIDPKEAVKELKEGQLFEQGAVLEESAGIEETGLVEDEKEESQAETPYKSEKEESQAETPYKNEKEESQAETPYKSEAEQLEKARQRRALEIEAEDRILAAVASAKAAEEKVAAAERATTSEEARINSEVAAEQARVIAQREAAMKAARSRLNTIETEIRRIEAEQDRPTAKATSSPVVAQMSTTKSLARGRPEADFDLNRRIAEYLSSAKEGDLEAVKAHLGTLSVDACIEAYGRTALHWGAETGNLTLCELLLDQRADPNFKDRESATPLHKAAWNGHSAVAKLLLLNGADPDLRDKDGETPAQGAATPGSLEVIYLESQIELQSKKLTLLREQQAVAGSRMRRAMKHRCFETRYGRREGRIGEALPIVEEEATEALISPPSNGAQTALQQGLWRTVLKLARVANSAEQGLIESWEQADEQIEEALGGIPLFGFQRNLLEETRRHNLALEERVKAAEAESEMSQRMGDSVWAKMKKTEAQLVALRIEAEERRCRTKSDLRVMGMYTGKGTPNRSLMTVQSTPQERSEYQVGYLLQQMESLAQSEKNAAQRLITMQMRNTRFAAAICLHWLVMSHRDRMQRAVRSFHRAWGLHDMLKRLDQCTRLTEQMNRMQREHIAEVEAVKTERDTLQQALDSMTVELDRLSVQQAEEQQSKNEMTQRMDKMVDKWATSRKHENAMGGFESRREFSIQKNVSDTPFHSIQFEGWKKDHAAVSASGMGAHHLMAARENMASVVMQREADAEAAHQRVSLTNLFNKHKSGGGTPRSPISGLRRKPAPSAVKAGVL